MVAFIIGNWASNMQVAHLFATADTKNVASQNVLRKLAGIETKTDDGRSRASFFERAAELHTGWNNTLTRTSWYHLYRRPSGRPR